MMENKKNKSHINENDKKSFKSVSNFVDNHQWFTPRRQTQIKKVEKISNLGLETSFDKTPNIPINDNKKTVVNQSVKPPNQQKIHQAEHSGHNSLLSNIQQDVFKIKLTSLINQLLDKQIEDSGSFYSIKYNILNKTSLFLNFNLTKISIPHETSWPEKPKMRLTNRGVVEYPLAAKVPIVFNKIQTDIIENKKLQIVKNDDVVLKLSLSQLQQIINDCSNEIIQKLQSEIEG